MRNVFDVVEVVFVAFFVAVVLVAGAGARSDAETAGGTVCVDAADAVLVADFAAFAETAAELLFVAVD